MQLIKSCHSHSKDYIKYKFKNEPYTFEAQVTGVVLSAGVAAKRDYNKGMAVFIMEDAGLMVDASLGGQKFNYEAKPVLKKVW